MFQHVAKSPLGTRKSQFLALYGLKYELEISKIKIQVGSNQPIFFIPSSNHFVLKSFRPQEQFVLKTFCPQLFVLKKICPQNFVLKIRGRIFWPLFLGQIFRPKLCLQDEIFRPGMTFRPPDVLAQNGQLGSSRVAVKRWCTRDPKIGMQSRFG